MDKEQRLEELQTSSWRIIRDAAERVGITDKPEDKSWDDMIPGIIALEFPDEEAQPEPVDAAEEEETLEQTEPDQPLAVDDAGRKRPTDLYKELGLDVCSKCGDKQITGHQGETLCSESAPETCPRFN